MNLSNEAAGVHCACCGAAAWPLVARAQAPKLPVIGFLRAGQPPKAFVEAFKNGLQEQGSIVGQNAVIEYRLGSTDQLPQLAEELARLKV